MDNAIQHVLLYASLITAAGTIWNVVAIFGRRSKKHIRNFIEKEMSPDLEKISKSIDALNDNMNEMKIDGDKDKMQRLRYECLCFASDIRKGDPKTRQEYEEVFRMESDYESLIEKYKIKNGYMEEEMLFVHEQYRKLSNSK